MYGIYDIRVPIKLLIANIFQLLFTFNADSIHDLTSMFTDF